MTNTIALFGISTEEDLRFHLDFVGIDLSGRALEIAIRERASSAVKATLTIGAGLTLTGTTSLTARYAKASMSSWARTEYSADLVDKTGGAYTRIMAVRFVYNEPGRLVYGVNGNKATIAFGPNQAVVTAIGGVGPTGPANTLTIGAVTTVAPGGSATASITGTAPSQTLNLGIPEGDKGDKGDKGDTGDTGDPGEATPEFIAMVEQAAADADATAADRVATGEDRAAVVDDRAAVAQLYTDTAEKAGDASDSAGVATTQAGIATTQSGNSATSATLAENWATKTSGTVDGSEYSAKQYALDAEAEADRAATYVPNQVASGISGLRMSNNASDASHDIDIAAGVARDKTSTVDIVLSSGLTKRLDAAWAAGPGNGGIDTGSMAANTTYHVFVIRKPSPLAVDVLFSASPTSPVLPSGYTQFRRLGSVVSGASNTILPFYQAGNYFAWKIYTDTFLINAAANGSVTLRSLLVPTGIKVLARFRFYASNVSPTTPSWVYFRDPDVEVPPAIGTYGEFLRSGDMGQMIDRWTNTLGQIYTYDNGTLPLISISPMGYWDFRDEYL